MIWKLLDLFFIVFHSVLILFNLFGWIFRSSRRLNLITLLITGMSWSLLGIIYGFGYCPVTDWHWQVLEKLGEPALHRSYVQYLFSRMLGIEMTWRTANTLTLVFFGLSLLCAVYVNFFIPQKRKR